MKTARTATAEWLDKINPRVVTAGFHRAPSGYRGPLRQHVMPDLDLWYIAAGRGALLLDGRWEHFESGDLLALKPGSLYQQDRSDEAHPFEVYFVHIEPFGETSPLDKELAEWWPLRLAVVNRTQAEALFRGLFEASTLRPPDGGLAGRGLALQIVQLVVDELALPGDRRRPEHPGLARAKQFIEQSYARDLRLRDLAAAAELSASHLSALFRQHYGLAPIEFVLQRRFREAELLLARGLRVKEVAQRVGFSSQHYFSRAFRRRTGLSPREFMLRHSTRDFPF